MTSTKACTACGLTLSITEFGILPSGNRRGPCNPCVRAAAAAAKQRYKASQAEAKAAARVERDRLRAEKAAAQLAAKEERAAARVAQAAARAEAAALKAAEQAREAAVREAQRNAARLEREERAAILHRKLWAAMWRGRFRRAVRAVRPSPAGIYRIELKHEGGFISVAELACRCIEREATLRATRTCTTPESVAAAVRILEEGTPTLERTKQMRGLWWTTQPPRNPEAHSVPCEVPEDSPDDWVPAWMGSERGSWTASLPA